jgi:hypothetical protein
MAQAVLRRLTEAIAARDGAAIDRLLGGPGSGDVEGHEFHGNQYTGGIGGSGFDDGEYVGPADLHPRVKDAFDRAAEAKVTYRASVDALSEKFRTKDQAAAEAEMHRKYGAYMDAEAHAKDVLFDEMSKGGQADILFESVVTEGPPGDRAYGRIPDDQREEVEQATSDLARIDHSGIPLPVLQVVSTGRDDRDGQAMPGGHILLGDQADAETVTHEVGHHYEFVSPRLLKAAQQLQDRRARTGQTWLDPYSATRYAPGWTEVVSTGLSAFMNNPVALKRTDPEHFALIRDMLQGKYATR